MVRVLPAVMRADTTSGRWPSVSVSEVVNGSSALPASSVRDAGTTARVPIASVAAASPISVIVWTGEPPPSSSPETVRVPEGGDRTGDEYAACVPSTFSLYVTVISLSPVILADSTLGGIPSPIATAVTASSSLPAASRTKPPLRRYVMSASGLVPVRLAASVRTSSVDPAEMSDLDNTIGLPAPDTDQPPGPVASVASLTGSSNTTRILAGASAVALSIVGSCPSDSVRFTTPAPNGLPPWSTTAGPSISIQPVALGAASASSNATVCVRVPFQSACVGDAVRISPPTKIDW